MADLKKIIVRDMFRPGETVEMKIGNKTQHMYRDEFNDLLAKMLAYDAASPFSIIKPKE